MSAVRNWLEAIGYRLRLRDTIAKLGSTSVAAAKGGQARAVQWILAVPVCAGGIYLAWLG